MRPSIHQRRHSPLVSTTTTLPALLLTLAAFIQPTLANPYPKDDLHDPLGAGFLMDRSCATYCGVDNQYCCAEGQACTTSGTVAGCTDTAYGGGWGLYTTTWTETDTFTSTLSSYYAAGTATAGGTCTPESGSNQIACGSICCASWQYCAYEGQCSANAGTATTTAAGGGGAAGNGATTTAAGATSYSTITTEGTTITTPYSAPYRVTSGASSTTNTAFLESATSTGSGGNGTAAVTTGGSSLSGGAIAGIVIGVLAGVVLLLAICACCLMRGLWHGLLAIFGLGPKKKSRSRSHDRETIIIEEERYARHGGVPGAAGAAGRRERHDSWFAATPAAARSGRTGRTGATDSRRMSQSEKRRESGNNNNSSNAGWWGAGALGTLGVMLGLQRDKKRKTEKTVVEQTRRRSSRMRSDVSSSYFSDSYTASSPSEFSSDYTASTDNTRPPQHYVAPARGARQEPAVVRDAGRGRGQYYGKSNVPPAYAGSASSGGRTGDTHHSRREDRRASRGAARR